MGIEALSRGAATCCFFERHRQALDALYRNLDTVGVGPEATVVTRDAWQSAICSADGSPFDLVLLDPPYADMGDVSASGPLRRYLGHLAERGDNRPLVVLHHPASVRVEVAPGDVWMIVTHRIHGTNAITMFIR